MLKAARHEREEHRDTDTVCLSLGTLAIVGVLFVMLVAAQKE